MGKFLVVSGRIAELEQASLKWYGLLATNIEVSLLPDLEETCRFGTYR